MKEAYELSSIVGSCWSYQTSDEMHVPQYILKKYLLTIPLALALEKRFVRSHGSRVANTTYIYSWRFFSNLVDI